jgi:hypothetical protein
VIRLLPVALLLAGCSAVSVHQASDPFGSDTLIGHNIRDVELCASKPDSLWLIGPDDAQAEWSFKGTSPSFSLSAPLIGAVSIGSPPSCKMDLTFIRDGTVTGVSFPQCTSTLFGGPYAAAGTLVGNCLRNLADTSRPHGYDAIAVFLPSPANAPKGAHP